MRYITIILMNNASKLTIAFVNYDNGFGTGMNVGQKKVYIFV